MNYVVTVIFAASALLLQLISLEISPVPTLAQTVSPAPQVTIPDTLNFREPVLEQVVLPKGFAMTVYALWSCTSTNPLSTINVRWYEPLKVRGDLLLLSYTVTEVITFR